jgi:hypothetical protein
MANKINKEQLLSIVKNTIKEQLELRDLLPGGDGKELEEYVSKVDNFIKETVEKMQELHDEGQDIIQTDILGGRDSSAKVGERNRLIMARVGILDKMKKQLVAAYEYLRNQT